MRYALYHASEGSILANNMPAYDAIQAAFTRGSPNGPRAAWVGPGPRVTRTSHIGEPFQTHVAWLYGFDDAGMTDAQVAAALADVLQRVGYQLLTVSTDFQPGEFQAYAPALNGSVDWWASGVAATTHTGRQPPEGWGRFADEENPVGPTTAENTPGNWTVPTVGLQAQGLANAALTIAKVAGVGLGIYVGWRVYDAWRYRRLAPGYYRGPGALAR